MKINKEQEVKTEIHKKKTGKIHKKNEAKIDNKSMTTRAKRSVNLAGIMAESTITENVEGGENIDGAFEATGIAIRAVKGAISEGNRIRKKVSTSKLQKEVAGKRIRKKASTKGKELAKKSVKNTSRNVAKKTSKKVVKDTTKESTKLTVKTGTTVAGSAAGPEETLIGMAAGEAVGMKIENTFYRAEQKSRMMKYFMDKLKSGEEQNDSLFKLVGSIVKNKVAYIIMQVMSLLAPLVVPILIVVMVATGIVFAIIAVLYNSPFAIFLPPLESEIGRASCRERV